MGWQYVPYIIPLGISSVMLCLLAYLASKRHVAPGTNIFIVLVLLLAGWSLAYALELTSLSLTWKLLWIYCEYVGIALTPVGWYLYLRQFIGRSTSIFPPYFLALLVIPVITILLIWTNAWHHLIYREVWLTYDGPYLMLDKHYGIWFWVHCGYSYLLLITTTIWCIHALWRRELPFRRQTIFLFISSLIPWLGNYLTISGMNPLPHLDLTPFGFGITALVAAVGRLQFGLQDIVPVARTTIIETMSDMVIVLDDQLCIIYLNQAASTLLNCLSDPIGKPVAQVMAAWEPLLSKFPTTAVETLEITHFFESVKSVYEVRIFPLNNTAGVAMAYLLTMRDITEQKSAEQLLRLQSTALESAANAIMITDYAGVIVRVNQAFTILTGYSVAETVGTTPRLLNSGLQADAFYRQLWQTILAGKVWSGELVNRRKDGSYYHERMTITPVRLSGADISHFIAIKEDISARVAAEIALAEARTRAESKALELSAIVKENDIARLVAEKARTEADNANRAKSEFLANMSHEIRTPLNGIIGITHLLLDTSLDAEQQDYLSTLRKSAEALLTVINDILDISKIEAGRLEFANRVFHLHTVVEDTLENLALQAEVKQVVLSCSIDDAVPEFLLGDPDRFRQVMTNLLGNAIKFTSRGAATLCVEFAGQQAQEILLRCTVRDTGIGISPSQMTTLFQPFSQGDSSFTRKYGGTGLGLSISKQLVEMMNGEIGVESIEGQGSTFWFTCRFSTVPAGYINDNHIDNAAFPLQVQSLHDATPVPVTPIILTHTPEVYGHILVAEDNATNQTVVRAMLQKLQFQVDVVSNGAEAVEAAERTHYDLILMDVQMPEMDGFEATRLISVSSPSSPNAHTPIIALTAHAIQGDRERCLQAGMSDYLSKPILPQELRAMIARWCTPSISATPSTLPVITEVNTSPIFDRDGVMNRLDNDEALLQEVMQLFLDNTAVLLDEATIAWSQQDWTTIRQLAHTLKGSAGNVGASQIQDRAKTLETACTLEIEPPMSHLTALQQALADFRLHVVTHLPEQ